MLTMRKKVFFILVALVVCVICCREEKKGVSHNLINKGDCVRAKSDIIDTA